MSRLDSILRAAAILGAAVVAFFAHSVTAQAFQFSFATPIPNETAVERALSFQVNRQVAKHWVVDPVSFVPSGGVVISVLPGAQIERVCQDVAATACHGGDVIYLRAHLPPAVLSLVLSHEVIETEVDHYSDAYVGRWSLEPCDPVEYKSYRLFGVTVSDYVYPAWFFRGARGPFDQLLAVKRALGPADGSMPPPR